jgi:hypothetical protein
VFNNKEDEMGGACSTNGEKRNTYGMLVGKTEGNSHQEDLDLDGRIISPNFNEMRASSFRH